MVDRGLVKCLVVDDDHDGGYVLGEFLRILGADVQVAHGGQEAIDLASAFQPRLVILDINMPGMDGFETCKRLRQQRWSVDAMFIAYTAIPFPRAHPLAAAFDRVVSKGDPPEVFESILNEVVV